MWTEWRGRGLHVLRMGDRKPRVFKETLQMGGKEEGDQDWNELSMLRGGGDLTRNGTPCPK